MALVAYSPIAKGRIKTDQTLAGIGDALPQDAGAGLPALAGATECGRDPAHLALERLSENIEIFDFELSDDEMAQISAMAQPKGRLTDFGFAPKWD